MALTAIAIYILGHTLMGQYCAKTGKLGMKVFHKCGRDPHIVTGLETCKSIFGNFNALRDLERGANREEKRHSDMKNTA